MSLPNHKCEVQDTGVYDKRTICNVHCSTGIAEKAQVCKDWRSAEMALKNWKQTQHVPSGL